VTIAVTDGLSPTSFPAVSWCPFRGGEDNDYFTNRSLVGSGAPWMATTRWQQRGRRTGYSTPATRVKICWFKWSARSSASPS